MTGPIPRILPISYTYNVASLLSAFRQAAEHYTNTANNAAPRSAEHSMNECFATSTAKDIAILEQFQNEGRDTINLPKELSQLPTFGGPQFTQQGLVSLRDLLVK